MGARQKAASQSSVPSEKPVEGARVRRRALGRALVVEDDAILGMELVETLRGGGAKSVELCTSISDAMAKIEATRFDVVILDVHLEDRSDGWALAELLKELGPRPPRIVFSTGSPDAIPPAIAGLGKVLEKPYAPEELLAALDDQAAPNGLFAKLVDSLTRS